MAELSPMMRQYLEIKERNPGSLLFFRLGDFYEMFFDDAKQVSQELDLVLTGRDCGLEERAPMCGVPYHSYEAYVARLVAKGYKVAICEQMEDPATAKGIVKRDIVRVITPGTVTESSMLDESRNNYICSVFVEGGQCGVCFADVSTGETFVTELRGNIARQLPDEIARYSPSELLLSPDVFSLDGFEDFLRARPEIAVEPGEDDMYDLAACDELMKAQFGAERLEQDGMYDRSRAMRAAGALLRYLQHTQRQNVDRITELSYYIGEQFMRLDYTARRNLELCQTMRDGEKKGSLLWVLDRTKTAMGKRLIRKWIEQPLVNASRIQSRLNAVEELSGNAMLRDGIIDALTGMSDLERIMTRIVYGSAGARELRSVAYSASRLPALKASLQGVTCSELRGIFDDIDCLEDIAELIESAIVDDPPQTVREGGIIRPGYSKEADELRDDMSGGKDFIARVEASEREKTGIPKLKVGYNRVFGYYIEVTNSYRDQVPQEYIRKQTLTNCERYITQELKELEGRVLGAQDRLYKLEYQLFDEIRSKVAAQLERVQRTASAAARLDVLCSFADVAVTNRYTRPLVNTSGRIVLSEARHPVVEALLDVPFVPNDVTLDNGDNRVAIITGPNMAGKSTYMRQTALIVLMAQIGCFVPATSAEIGVVDGIYTRVGASDDLSTGKSTFMVEMSEVADILRNATSNSLLILDEIGRGTSTFDGMSIARAVLECAADRRRLGAKTMFATHYHELTVLEDTMKGVKNYNIAAKKHGDDIIFLRRIVRGGADDSYGIEVAKLAGVPDSVIKRAKVVLRELESGKAQTAPTGAGEQMTMSFTPPGEQEAVIRLKQLDVNSLTPMEAIGILDKLCQMVKD